MTPEILVGLILLGSALFWSVMMSLAIRLEIVSDEMGAGIGLWVLTFLLPLLIGGFKLLGESC